MDFQDSIRYMQGALERRDFRGCIRESLSAIEIGLRHSIKAVQHIAEGHARIRLMQTEIELGKGQNSLDEFTLGELVRLEKSSGFFDAWSASIGEDLSSLKTVRLDELNRLRNRMIHRSPHATEEDASLLFHFCRQLAVAYEKTMKRLERETRGRDAEERGNADAAATEAARRPAGRCSLSEVAGELPADSVSDRLLKVAFLSSAVESVFGRIPSVRFGCLFFSGEDPEGLLAGPIDDLRDAWEDLRRLAAGHSVLNRESSWLFCPVEVGDWTMALSVAAEWRDSAAFAESAARLANFLDRSKPLWKGVFDPRLHWAESEIPASGPALPRALVRFFSVAETEATMAGRERPDALPAADAVGNFAVSPDVDSDLMESIQERIRAGSDRPWRIPRKVRFFDALGHMEDLLDNGIDRTG